MAIGFGAFLPLSNSIVIDLRPSGDRSRIFALLGVSVFIGFGTGNILGGMLIASDIPVTRSINFRGNCLHCIYKGSSKGKYGKVFRSGIIFRRISTFIPLESL
ncbi:MAG: hypothetical protein ACXACO_21125 [Promethearchaeota archaeon]